MTIYHDFTTDIITPSTGQVTVNGAFIASGTVNVAGPIMSYANGNGGSAIGDGFTTLYNNNSRFSFVRQLNTGARTDPAVFIQLDNYANGYTLPSYNIYPGVIAFQVNATSHPNSTGSIVAMQSYLYSEGNNAFYSEDVGNSINVQRLGHNSTWAVSTQSQDITGLLPDSFATIGMEIDLVTNGPDPNGNRFGLLFSFKNNPTTTYNANTLYSSGTLISALPAGANANLVYIAQNTGYTGATPPVWANTYLSTFTDNTITWKVGTAFNSTVGNAIWAGGNPGVIYNTVLGSSANIGNAAIDLTHVTMAYANSAGIRLPQNVGIDFSGDGTSSGKNQHTLGYGSYYKQLAYSNPAGTIFSINDTGFSISMAGAVQICYGSNGNLAAVSSGYVPEAITFGRNYTNFFNEADIMVPANGLNIYSVNSNGYVINSSSNPIISFNTSNTTIYTNTIVQGNANVLGNMTVNSTFTSVNAVVTGIQTFASGPSANVLGRYFGYNSTGMTIAQNYMGNNEIDMIVPAGGFGIFPMSGGGYLELGIPTIGVNTGGTTLTQTTTVNGTLNVNSVINPGNNSYWVSSPGGIGFYQNPPYVGNDTTTFGMMAGRATFLKNKNMNSNNPCFYVQMNNEYNFPLASYGLYPQISTLLLGSTGYTGANASLDTINVSQSLYGNSPYLAQDVCHQITVNQYGHDSSWAIDIAMYDYSGEPCQSFSQMAIEIDMYGNGPDEPTSQYDSLHCNRTAFWITPGTATQATWTSNTAYHTNGNNIVGSIIQAIDVTGNLSIYKCTTAGISGNSNSQPIWVTSGNISDNTCIWTYQQHAYYQVGRAVHIDGYGANGAYYGTGFSTNAPFTGAIIDISEGSFVGANGIGQGANAAGIRMAANMPIDFSGAGTQAAENQHTLGFYSFYNQLVYTSKGNNLFTINDTGFNVVISGNMEIAFGSEADVYQQYSNYSNTGMSINRNYSGNTEIDIMMPPGGMSFFPVTSNGYLVSANPIVNITQNGATLNGNSTISNISNLSISGIIHANKTGSTTPTGDAVPTLDFNGGSINARWQTLTSNTGGPGIFFTYDNYSNTYTVPPGWGFYNGVPGVRVDATNHANTTGAIHALQVNMSSQGGQAYITEDVGVFSAVNKYGQASTWGGVFQSDDFTGQAPASFAQLGIELDIAGNGPDNPATLYNPGASGTGRYVLYVNCAPQGATITRANNTAYPVHTVINKIATDGGANSGVLMTYIAQNLGTTGNTNPVWPSSGNVTDGTITWATGTTYNQSISNVLWVVGSPYTVYNNIVATNGTIGNAGLELSTATMASANSAGIRLAANMPIDFSGNGTLNGQNNHYLSYGSFYRQLAYVVNNVTAFSINDIGISVSMPGAVEIGYGANGNLALINTFPAFAMTLGHNYSNVYNEADIMVPANGLSVYTVNAAGYGANTGLPLVAFEPSGMTIPIGNVLVANGYMSLGITMNISANGTNQATAQTLNTHFNIINSCVSNANSAILKVPPIGSEITIVNQGTTNLQLYPPVNHGIDGLALNANTCVVAGGFYKIVLANTNHWYSTSYTSANTVIPNNII